MRPLILCLLVSGCGRVVCEDGTYYDERREACVAPSELPGRHASHETDLRVTLQPDGSYLLGATPLGEDALRTRVQRRVATAMHPVHVTLVASTELPQERVAGAVERLRGWGVDRVELDLGAPGTPTEPG